MNLRLKTLAIVGGTVTGLLAAVYFATRPVVLGEFEKAERENTRSQVERAKSLLQIAVRDFADKSQPNAAWRETQNFVRGQNPAFPNRYLTPNTLRVMNLDLVFIADKAGRELFKIQVDEKGKAISPDADLIARFNSRAPIFKHAGPLDPQGFFWSKGDQVWFLCSLPITNDDATAPVVGTYIAGRRVNERELAERLAPLGVPFTLKAPDDLPAYARDLPREIQAANGVLVREGTDINRGYALLPGLGSNAAAVLEITSPNIYSSRARTFLNSFALILAFCGAVFVLVAMMPLEKLVLSRLARLSHHIENLRSSGDLTRRVEEDEGDELGVLGANINRTLTALQQVASRQRRSEALFRQMAQIALSAGDAYFVMQKGQDFLHWHGDIDALLGYPAGGMQRTQRAWLQHIHRVDQGKVQRACSRALHMREGVEVDFRVIRCDGEIRHWLLRGRPLEVDIDGTKVNDGSTRLVAVCVDITERKAAEERLREGEERLQRIFETAADAIIIADADGLISFVNSRAEAIFGLTRDEIIGRTTDDPMWSITDLDGSPFPSEKLPFNQVRAYGEPVYEVRHLLAHADGTSRIVSINAAPLLDHRGRFSGMVASMSDVTEREALNQRLEHQAMHDALTGLPNRKVLLSHLERALNRSSREANEVAVLFIDLDNFKYINDSLGHAAGDDLIVAIAKRLRLSTRGGDTPARFGGDEFVILLEGVDTPRYAIMVAERLLDALKEPFLISGREVFSTPSIGIAFSGADYTHPEELLRHADAAMYEAKRRGKACYAIYQDSMSAEAIKRLDLENDLRRALAKGEFTLHFQPKWDLGDDEIAGFEALVRWQHPERGLVMPGDFIPVAEETGLIVPLGFQVLRAACLQAKVWAARKGRPLSMAVNISARQLHLPEIVPLVAEAVAESGISPSCLILEITESAIVEKTGEMVKTLTALRELGVKLAIDDFGTGYSSLSYLRAFPFDYLKIDRQFVTHVHDEDGNGAIVTSMITLAHALKLKVIAEGAELSEEVTHLKKLGCDMAQGYFFGRPLTVSQIEGRFGFYSNEWHANSASHDGALDPIENVPEIEILTHETAPFENVETRAATV